jgi:phosphate transport system permease protein
LKTNFKQIKEKVIEGVLMLSSAATSITVILIVFFYLSKVLGFTRKPIDKGFYYGSKWVKPVNRLEPSQIKDVLIKKSQIE